MTNKTCRHPSTFKHQGFDHTKYMITHGSTQYQQENTRAKKTNSHQVKMRGL